MAKKILLITLGLGFFIELSLTVGAFFFPLELLKAFKVNSQPDSFFLIHIIGWFLIVIDTLCYLAIVKVKSGKTSGWIISYLLGIWWVALGISVFFCFGKTDNLFLDSIKGLIIVVCAKLSAPKSQLS
jgi:hypothetical protein